MQLIPRGSDLKTVAPSLSFFDFFSLSLFLYFSTSTFFWYVRRSAAVAFRQLSRSVSALGALGWIAQHQATGREASWENCRILPGYFPPSPGTAKENQSSEENPNWHFGLVHTGIDLKPFFRGDLTYALSPFLPFSFHLKAFWSCHVNDNAASSNVGFKNTITCQKSNRK